MLIFRYFCVTANFSVTMINKDSYCGYCGEEMKVKNRRKTYCSDKCRTYAYRDKKFKAAVVPPTVEDELLVPKIGFKSGGPDKPVMPPGLTIAERIKWMEEHRLSNECG